MINIYTRSTLYRPIRKMKPTFNKVKMQYNFDKIVRHNEYRYVFVLFFLIKYKLKPRGNKFLKNNNPTKNNGVK